MNSLFSLITFTCILRARGDGKILSVSSSDEESVNLNGFGVRVYEDNGSPQLVYYDNTDSTNTVYCLEFSGLYEISEESYNKTECESGEIGDIVSNSEFDFSTVDWKYDNCNGSNTKFTDCTFAFYTSSEKFDLLLFEFHLIESNNGTIQTLIKFDIVIKNYTWVNENDNDYLGLRFKISECTDEYTELQEEFESESDSDDDNNEDESVDDDSNDNESESNRRLLDDDSNEDDNSDSDESNESNESNESESESLDSNEADFEASFFIIEDYANNGEVTSTLCPTDSSENEITLNVIYSHFDDNLMQDPKTGVDKDELAEEETDGDDDSGVVLTKNNFIVTMAVCLVTYYVW